jgi:hypothetical protein
MSVYVLAQIYIYPEKNRGTFSLKKKMEGEFYKIYAKTTQRANKIWENTKKTT